MYWHTTRFRLDLARPRVMGIVNLTPDSFFDGGRLGTSAGALRHAEQLLKEGADVLDFGAESSRPGGLKVPADEEWRRLEPVLRGALRFGVPVSVDTCKRTVMQQALDLGVDAVNDIQALRAPGALDLLAAHPNAGVCVMHMRGEPTTMQRYTRYADVGMEVAAFLSQRAERLRARGIARERVVLDPGYGFAKTPVQNLALQRTSALRDLGYPLLAGWSRKSTLGWLTGAPAEGRLPASLAAALAAVHWGARLLRVHDVGATVQALRTWSAMVEVAENEAINVSARTNI